MIVISVKLLVKQRQRSNLENCCRDDGDVPSWTSASCDLAVIIVAVIVVPMIVVAVIVIAVIFVA